MKIINALRPNHLGCYGYHRNTSPNIRPLQNAERNCLKIYSDILLIRKFKDIYNMLEITDADEGQMQLVTQNAYNTQDPRLGIK